MSGLLSDRSGLLKRCVGGVTRKQHSDNLDFTKIIVSTDVNASNGARMVQTEMLGIVERSRKRCSRAALKSEKRTKRR